MSEANKEELKKLVESYLNGSATPEERKALESYYALFDSAPEASEILAEGQLAALRDKMKEKISSRIPRKTKSLFNSFIFRAAAAIIVLAGLGCLLMLTPVDKTTVSDTISATGPKETKMNRFIKLPDGSIVVLHNGSKIEIAKDFNQTTRTVHLSGEAYFDVFHQKEKPFIIHTGKLKTTVLGTAFNVKAWPNEKDVTVTVTRGKVRVDDDNKLIAILTPDKQVTYDATSYSEEGSKITSVTETTNWMHQDMAFDNLPFGELAKRLGERYGTEITFSNPALELCGITGNFSGTETLDEVLRILSLTSNTRYSTNENGVVIEGEKCN